MSCMTTVALRWGWHFAEACGRDASMPSQMVQRRREGNQLTVGRSSWLRRAGEGLRRRGPCGGR
eukprot:3384275-Pyramimonas_sp.AAC.1